MATEQELRRPELFDSQYELIRMIGRGRSSVVYEAQKIALQKDEPSRTLAIKILTSGGKNAENQAKRVQREALALLSCRHPNVIRLYDYVATPDIAYLAMEMADRGDLKKELTALEQPFSAETALRLTQHVLGGLKAIHDAGIVHADIKPENLLLTSAGYLKIGDFTAAQLPSDERMLLPRGTGVGTFDYLAPECLDQGTNSVRSDLYSTAVVLYQMLTLKVPFSGASFSEQVENKLAGIWIADPSTMAVNPPENLDAFMAKALSTNPDRRFSSAQAFSKAIDQLLDGSWTDASTRQSRGMLYMAPYEPRRNPHAVSETGEPIFADELHGASLHTSDQDFDSDFSLGHAEPNFDVEPMLEVETMDPGARKMLIYSGLALAVLLPTLIYLVTRNAQDTFFDKKIEVNSYETTTRVVINGEKPALTPPSKSATTKAPAAESKKEAPTAFKPAVIEAEPVATITERPAAPAFLKNFSVPEICGPTPAQSVANLKIASAERAGLITKAVQLHLDTAALMQLMSRISAVETGTPLWNPRTADCQTIETNDQLESLTGIDQDALTAVVDLRELRKSIYETKLRELLASGSAQKLNQIELEHGIDNTNAIISSIDLGELNKRVAALEAVLSN